MPAKHNAPKQATNVILGALRLGYVVVDVVVSTAAAAAAIAVVEAVQKQSSVNVAAS